MKVMRGVIFGLAGLAVAGSVHAELGIAVEYYNTRLRHYFITANPVEVQGLDGGFQGPDWIRTGGEFTVFTDPAPDRAAVCRFFLTPGFGVGTHFYTANPAECEFVKQSPAWIYENVAFFVQLPANGACGGGTTPVYRSFFSDQVSDANHRFTVDLTVASRMATKTGWSPEGIVMCVPLSQADVDADAVRLLDQATLGASLPGIDEVKAKGVVGWVDQQLGMNATRYTQYPHFDRPADPTACVDNRVPGATPEQQCHTYNIAPWPIAWEFFRQSKTAPDQLRLRMAHVWHQIFVTSDGQSTGEYAYFQQLLRDNVFGTFENLLTRYALSPMLGEFQNWIHNVPEHDGIKPNENFARELMQLFTIGVDVLNEDGTPKLDASGHRVPAYAQSDIEALARVLTGYGFPVPPGATPTFDSPRYYYGEMIPYQAFHDKGTKYALGGRLVLYPGGNAASEVAAMIRVLVDHPNTPQFISRQLIQKTVTSSPTPGYVSRVAAVFRNNGAGVRGDLAAVTRAILLDPEARGARKIDAEYGRMREPALYWTGLIRGLDVTTDGVLPFEEVAEMGQVMFLPESVFNYYPADYTLFGTDVPAPEFGLYGSSQFLIRLNVIVNLVTSAGQPFAQDWYGPRSWVRNALGTQAPALVAQLAGLAADPAALVSRIDTLFMHGTMSPAMRSIVVNAVSKLPASQAVERAKLALRVVLSSVDYHVQK